MKFNVSILGGDSPVEMEMKDSDFYTIREFLDKMSDSHYILEPVVDELGCPMTDWNTEVIRLNKKFISMDNDSKEKRLHFLTDARYYLKDKFDISRANYWYRNQCVIAGFEKMASAFDFDELYPTDVHLLTRYSEKAFKDTWFKEEEE